jgi:transposase
MAGRAHDGKAQELAASRTLNPRPEAVLDEGFRGSEFFDARDLVQVKYELVRRVEADGVAVGAAAGAFGFSRQSYYTAARALADDGLAGLVPAKPGPRGAHKLTDEVLEHLEALRETDPGLGAAELAAAVAERFGVTVHRTPACAQRSCTCSKRFSRPARHTRSSSNSPPTGCGSPAGTLPAGHTPARPTGRRCATTWCCSRYTTPATPARTSTDDANS